MNDDETPGRNSGTPTHADESAPVKELAKWHARLHREAHRADIDASIYWVAQAIFIIGGVLLATLFLIWAFRT
jgi:hypothetical protein